MTSETRSLLVMVALAALWPGPSSAQDAAAQARAAFENDVHAAAGLTCASCHATQIRLKADPTTDKDVSSPFSAPARTAIAPLCAKCHSDAGYMRQFAPPVRVDQFTQYLTSVHGKRMSEGDERVATCSDCHGAHGITRASDSRSPVAPLNAAGTCARCHADTTRMAAFGRTAAPVDDWSASVHALALLNRGDTSAPTCHTCHGSHGATPPGVAEVANVCSQCHVREAELFRASPKNEIFEAIGQPECLACHSNHRIEKPADAWVGLGKDDLCATCHDMSMAGAKTIQEIRSGLNSLTGSIDTATDVLERAARAGMLVDEGRAALREAHEHLIHTRVLVHSFADKPVADVVAPGLDATQRAGRVGEQALAELQVRRRGLALATLLIFGFLITLWFKIRALPPIA